VTTESFDKLREWAKIALLLPDNSTGSRWVTSSPVSALMGDSIFFIFGNVLSAREDRRIEWRKRWYAIGRIMVFIFSSSWIWYVLALRLFIQGFVCGRDAVNAVTIEQLVIVEASHLAKGLQCSFLAAGGAPFVAVGASQNDAFVSRRDRSGLIGCGIHRSISPRLIYCFEGSDRAWSSVSCGAAWQPGTRQWSGCPRSQRLRQFPYW